MGKAILAIILSVAMPAAAKAAEQTPVQGGTPPPATNETGFQQWLKEWDGFVEFQLRPAIGEPINRTADDDVVDDSEYEALLRIRRPLDSLRGIRLQLQGGVVSTPNLLDGENSQSALYGEIQLGDTYIPYTELRRANFRVSAAATRPNAFRPYVRYRYSRLYDGLLEDYSRTDHRATAGLRYRRVPFTVEQRHTEDGRPEPAQILPGLYFELRAELSRVWSTNPGEELWNPRLQLDVYSRPFWNGTRFVFRATGEMSIYDNALAPNGDERVDTRLRVVAGFDLTEPLEDLLDLKDGIMQAELMGRFQVRWSNDPGREHTRLYFVPTVTITLPLQ